MASRLALLLEGSLNCVSEEGGGGRESSLVELDSLTARVVLNSCFSGTVFVTLFLPTVETLSSRDLMPILKF